MPATAMRPRTPTATAGARRLRAPQRGERREGEHRAADGQRRAAREGDDPVGADEHAGRRQAVDDEQQRHRAEGAAGDSATGRRGPGRRRSPRARQANAAIDEPTAMITRCPTPETGASPPARERVQGGGRHGGAACDEEEMRPEAAAEKPVHIRVIGHEQSALDDRWAECGRCHRLGGEP